MSYKSGGVNPKCRDLFIVHSWYIKSHLFQIATRCAIGRDSGCGRCFNISRTATTAYDASTVPKNTKRGSPCLQGRNSTRFGWRESRRRASTGDCFGNRGSYSKRQHTQCWARQDSRYLCRATKIAKTYRRRPTVRTPRLLSSPALY